MDSKYDSVLEAQQANDRKNREREISASRFPNDKLRVVADRHQSVASRNGQILTFRPTTVIDDQLTIDLMDELGVEYTVVSQDLTGAVGSGKTCSFKGCKDPRDPGSALCLAHTNFVLESAGKAPVVKTCVIPDCSDAPGSELLCEAHEQQLRAAMEAANGVAPANTRCLVPDCATPPADDVPLCEDHTNELADAIARFAVGAQAAPSGDWSPAPDAQ
jgi:hypothetical protein